MSRAPTTRQLNDLARDMAAESDGMRSPGQVLAMLKSMSAAEQRRLYRARLGGGAMTRTTRGPRTSTTRILRGRMGAEPFEDLMARDIPRDRWVNLRVPAMGSVWARRFRGRIGLVFKMGPKWARADLRSTPSTFIQQTFYTRYDTARGAKSAASRYPSR